MEEYDTPEMNVSLWNSSNTTGEVEWWGNVTVTPGGEVAGGELGVGASVTLGIALCTLCLLTFLGNAMVLHAIRVERRLQTVSNMFILSLACSDLIVGMIVMPISTAYVLTDSKWIFGLELCQIWLSVDYTASTASIFNLLILSLDRYWSITQPLRYLHKRTKKRALLMIFCVWSMSSLWIIPIVSWHHILNGGVRRVPADTCDTEFYHHIFFKVATSIGNFEVPMLTMICLYGKIFHEIKKRSQLDVMGSVTYSNTGGLRVHGPSTSSSSGAASNAKSRRRASKGTKEDNHVQGVTGSIGRRLSAKKPRRTTEEVVEDGKRPVEEEEEDEEEEEEYSSSGESLGQGEGMSQHPVEDTRDEDTDSDGTRRTHFTNLTLLTFVNRMAEASRSPMDDLPPLPLEESFSSVKVKVDYMDEEEKDDEGCRDPLMIHEPPRKSSRVAESAALNKETSFTYMNHPAAAARRRRKKRREKKKLRRSQTAQQVRRTSAVTEGRALTAVLTTGDAAGGRRKTIAATTAAPINNGRASQAASPDDAQTTAESDDANKRPSKSFLQTRFRRRKFAVAVPNKASHAVSTKDPYGRLQLKREKKAAKQLGVILGAFILMWLPYSIFFIVVAFCDTCIPAPVYTASIWLGYVNSTLNPFLYPLCNSNFRNAFRRILTCSGEEKRVIKHTNLIVNPGLSRSIRRGTTSVDKSRSSNNTLGVRV